MHKEHLDGTEHHPEAALDGPAVEAIVALLDRLSAADHAEQVRRGHAANAEGGHWNGGRAPFGYRSVITATVGTRRRKKLEIEPDEAKTLQFIMELAAGGVGQDRRNAGEIAEQLNAAGRTLRGAKFARTKVVRILHRLGDANARRISVGAGPDDSSVSSAI